MQTTTNSKYRKGDRNRSGKKQRRRGRAADSGSDKRRPRGRSTKAADTTPVPASGVLELHPKAYSFLRDPAADYRPSPTDVYVAKSLIEQFGLRPGNMIRGLAREVHNGRGPQLAKFDSNRQFVEMITRKAGLVA